MRIAVKKCPALNRDLACLGTGCNPNLQGAAGDRNPEVLSSIASSAVGTSQAPFLCPRGIIWSSLQGQQGWLRRVKGTPTGSPDSVLEVVQSESAIEITRVESGKRTTSRCPFSGAVGDYTSPGGLGGTCKAQLKGKNLIVESVVLTHPQPTARVRIHTKDRWQLSGDTKTLTIKSDVDFPDFPAGVSAAVAGDTSTTTKYTRTENP